MAVTEVVDADADADVLVLVDLELDVDVDVEVEVDLADSKAGKCARVEVFHVDTVEKVTRAKEPRRRCKFLL